MTRKLIKPIRFTEEEFEKIKQHSERCGISFSSYVRECALNHKPKGRDMSNLIHQIAKQGGLLKHLHNEGLGHSDQTSELLREMQKTIKYIRSDEVESKNQ
ncbi:hypothetical protein FACS1894187_02640 [Synergistales bacterium]|nr:hypothetical protein FACS1894187_02640 [Synergistales bacterium]